MRYTSTQLKSTSLLPKAIASFQENLTSFWNYGNQNQEHRMTAPVYTFSPIHMNISNSIYNMDTSIQLRSLLAGQFVSKITAKGRDFTSLYTLIKEALGGEIHPLERLVILGRKGHCDVKGARSSAGADAKRAA